MAGPIQYIKAIITLFTNKKYISHRILIYCFRESPKKDLYFQGK
jgi:hypothetical protein